MTDDHTQRAGAVLLLSVAMVALFLRLYVLEGRTAKLEAVVSASRSFKVGE